MPIVIVPNEKGTPVGKLADAEIHFEKGPLAGLKLVGFGIWESQWAGKGRHQFLRVTLPSRDYEVNGEKRRYDLVRPVDADRAALEPLLDAILDAYTAGTDTHHDQPPADRAEAIARQTWRQAQAGTPRPASRPAPRPSSARPSAMSPVSRRPAQPRATGTEDDYPF